MKKSRFTDAQIIGVLREAEAGAEIRELSRRHGIAEQTFYRWRNKYGGMDGARPGGCSSSRRRIAG